MLIRCVWHRQGGGGRTYRGACGAERWLEWGGGGGERSWEKDERKTGTENMTDEWDIGETGVDDGGDDDGGEKGNNNFLTKLYLI